MSGETPKRFAALISGNLEFLVNGKRSSGKLGIEPIMVPSPCIIDPNKLWKEHVEVEDEFVSQIYTGSAASHCFAVLGKSGYVFAFGRNESGQLGLGDLSTRNIDFAGKIHIFGGDSELKIASIACGKTHTLFLTESGALYSSGDNKFGQLGTGTAFETPVTKPVKCTISGGVKITAIDAGIDFSLALDENGVLYSFGCGEYGKLGNGTDGSYNASSSSVKMRYEPFPVPTPVKFPSSRSIMKFAAGNHHCVAIDQKGIVYTWGCGTYGRLGLGQRTADSHLPTKVENGHWTRNPPHAKIVSAGGTSSILVSENGASWIWGKVKPNEESRMSPQLLQDLQGWDVICLSTGPASVGVGADLSTIEWGFASGELGFGAHKKSSSQPAKNDLFEGMRMEKICMGLQHTMFLVDASSDEVYEKIFNEFEHVPASQSAGIFAHDQIAEESSEEKASKKKVAAGGKRGSKAETSSKKRTSSTTTAKTSKKTKKN